ncbi:MAG: alpha/beta hydrolase [Chloroflexota bacterium]
MGISEKSTQLSGLNIHFWEAGEGHPRSLLLVHGGIGDAYLHWEPSIEALAEDYHVLAPDLPGFGKSDVLPKMQTEAMLQWIKDFLENQGIGQAVVIGNSMGALLVRLFAAGNPQLVPAVILMNGGGVPDLPPVFRILERIPGVSQGVFYLFGKTATSPATLKDMFYGKELLTEAFVEQAKNAAPGYARLMRMFVGSPMPKAQSPLVPTLILWGANDHLATLKDGEAIKASIPGATLTEITECGHMPQLETMDVFVWQVNTFLEKLSRPTQPNRPSAGMLSNLPG